MKQSHEFSPPNWREARRKRAFELHDQGWSQHAIAEALGISQAAVSQWLASGQWRAQAKHSRGAIAKVSADQLRLLPDLLGHGAEVWGFRGELWTCARVAAVIKEEFGVLYSRAHVSRLLKALDWTPQRPIERASQRDEAAIAAWRARRWPLLEKKARANGRQIVFIDESGFYLLPAVRRTYAPRAQTPVLRAPCRYDHLSVMAAVTMDGRLYTRVRERSLDSFDCVAFLEHLRGQLPNGKLLVIWDGSPIHRFKAMRELLATKAAEHFVLERLPAYAPDLNPLDTGVWHLLKESELGNVCCRNLKELRQVLTAAIQRLRGKPRLIQACFGGAKLSLR